MSKQHICHSRRTSYGSLSAYHAFDTSISGGFQNSIPFKVSILIEATSGHLTLAYVGQFTLEFCGFMVTGTRVVSSRIITL